MKELVTDAEMKKGGSVPKDRTNEVELFHRGCFVDEGRKEASEGWRARVQNQIVEPFIIVLCGHGLVLLNRNSSSI